MATNNTKRVGNMKRFGIPTALVVGGVTAGSLFAPIGFASAQESETDTGSESTVESETVESETGEPETGGQGERGRRGHAHRSAKSGALSDALGLSREEIRDGFSEGNTVADLAESQGIAVEEVEAALVAAANERIDAAVEAGRLDPAEADEKRAEVETRVGELMTADPSELGERAGKGRKGPGHHRPGKGMGAEVVQETLGLTAEEIRAGLQDGKTLSDLAAEQGVSAEDLAAAMIAAAEERIDAAVEAGKVDADRAAEKLAELEDKIDDVINGELPERPRRGR